MSSLQIASIPKSPAATLSSDLLYIIARLTYPEIFIEPQPRCSGSFIDLTRVCRHWRYTFLSYPFLWTNIHVPQRSIWYLKDILTRSADFPLQVIINLECPPELMVLQFDVIFAHLHRMQSLVFRQQIYTYNEPILNYIFPYISKPAPMLETFYFDLLTCTSNGWHHPDVKLKPGGYIPEILFAEHTPNLKELLVSSMKLSPQTSIFKTITHLSLKHVHGLTSPHHLLDILEAVSSHLETLELVFTMNYVWKSSIEDFTRPAIRLSCLETLLLNVSSEVLKVILDHTNIPPTVGWEIDCGDIMSYTRDLVPLIMLLWKLQKGVHINFTIDGCEIHVQFRNDVSAPCVGSFKIQASVKHLRGIRDILLNIGLSSVHSCELICLRKRAFPAWIATYEQRYQGFFFLFGQMDKLSIACENGKQLRNFTSLLEPRKAVDDTTVIVPCPLLSDLKVGLVTTGRSLIKLLASRKEAGYVLTNLLVDYDNRVGVFDLKTRLMQSVENVETVGKAILVPEDTDFVKRHAYKRISYTRENTELQFGLWR